MYCNSTTHPVTVDKAEMCVCELQLYTHSYTMHSVTTPVVRATPTHHTVLHTIFHRSFFAFFLYFPPSQHISSDH